MDENLLPPEAVVDGPESHPPRCPECASIIEIAYPASRGDGRWEGRCQTHGLVGVVHGRREEIRHLKAVPS